jgi:hypothetical protein
MRRLIGWLLTLVIVLPLLTAATLWFAGPSLFAPVEDFPQGPGGAIAYISLFKQLQPQLGKLLTGKDLTLVMTPAEANGMLSSALLAGRKPGAPIQKVRSALGDHVITVDLIHGPGRAPGWPGAERETWSGAGTARLGPVGRRALLSGDARI